MSHPHLHPAHLTHEAAHWHALQREAALTPALQAQFMDWLVASPEHLREYLAVSRIAGELGDLLRQLPDANSAGATQEVGDAPADNIIHLPKRSMPAVTPIRKARLRTPRFAQVAAVGVIAIGLATMAYAYWPTSQRYLAAHGAPRVLQLSDGTVVHLNAESELHTRMGWLQRRVELVRGQASFEVAEERRPFAVHAAGLQVRDIGTTFGVSLMREQASVDVSDGRVQVHDDSEDGRILADLRAGQRARIAYRDHTVTISQEDTDNMSAWWRRRIVFRNEPLGEVADQFNRLNAIRLRVDDGASRLRLTGNLSADDPDSLRAFLDEQRGLSTYVAGNEIRVSLRQAPPSHVRLR